MRFLADELPEKQMRYFREHASLCRNCWALLEIEKDLDETFSDDDNPGADEIPLTNSTAVGRRVWWLASAAAIVLAFLLGQSQTDTGAVTQVAFRHIDAFALVRASETTLVLPRSARYLTLVIPAPDAQKRYVVEIATSGSSLFSFGALTPVDLEITVALPVEQLPEQFELAVSPMDEKEDRRIVHIRVQHGPS